MSNFGQLLKRSKVFGFLLIAGAIALIDLLQRFIPDSLIHWHYILQRFYYLPIIAAGLAFGWRLGLAAALLAGVSYATQYFSGASFDSSDILDKYLECLVFSLVGTLTGVLSIRERKQRWKVEITATRLAEVYRELQDNVEHVKRAARMSALGHLSAGLAHEIRNPLASIEGAAGIVRREPKNDRLRNEFLDIIEKESHRLNNLVSSFLDFARPRPPELSPTDINALIDSLLLLVSQTAAKGMVTFHKDSPPQLRPLRCDSEQLKQVLLNLALNAVQAMPKGGQVTVSAREEEGWLVIRVRDEGEGIAPDRVESIFDPFFTTKPNGTGLGLAVAYQIVEQHGGELSLEENGPTGAGFAVRIPYERKTT
jgi:signal transduction histidine kinase